MKQHIKFGYQLATLFAILGFFLFYIEHSFQFAFAIAIILISLCLIKSEYLKTIEKLWHKLGIWLAMLANPIVMGLMFFIIITPIALLMKVFGRDALLLKTNSKLKSFWIKREHQFNAESFKDQF
jgi:hypothetical protein